VWAIHAQCPISQLAAILGLCRDHHPYRRAIVAQTLDDLLRFCSGSAHALPTIVAPTDRRLSAAIFPDSVPLSSSIDQKRLLEEICRRYEDGETLSFAAVYDRRAIDPALLSSFPFYLFNRRRCWKEPVLPVPLHLTSAPSRTRELTPPMNVITHAKPLPLPGRGADTEEKVFMDLINHYSAPYPLDSRRSFKPALSVPSFSCILLTGANGMLGARLLSLLIQLPSVTVCCPIRGDDGWARLTAAFASHALDYASLRAARDRGVVRVLSTPDLCAPQLGLSPQDHAWLCQNVDQVVHAAWNVNFNLPLSEFRGLLDCTRALAELCIVAYKRVRLFFIGTHASTFGYMGSSVPERILEPRLADAMKQVLAMSFLHVEM
jgi:hypothetical protein